MGTVLWILLAIIIILMIIAVCIFGGELANLVWPKDYAKVGDTIDVFLDGVYDRSAQISSIKSNCIYIYNSLPLPLNYRGKFYSIGIDTNGVKFWYVKTRKLFRLIPLAEKVRAKFVTQSDPYQMPPVYTETDKPVEESNDVNEQAKEG